MSKKIFIAGDKVFDFWIENNCNVLFEGDHGVGKTMSILDSWKRHNLNFLYFSASTMDPWIDFVGVPEKIVDPDDPNKSFLQLVRPRLLAEDVIDAIFIDEYNRAHKKVRNAVMELIQFKSINGKKFDRLKLVWAAINPDGGPYDTDALDPAQRDRFQIQVKVPFDLNMRYLASKYNSDIAEAASEWWYGINEELRKKHCSPRRLDYALDLHLKGGDIKMGVLDPCLGVDKLLNTLNKGPIIATFEKIYKKNDDSELKKFLTDPNNWNDIQKTVKGKKEYLMRCLPLLPNEIQNTLLLESPVRVFVLRTPEKFMDLIERNAKESTNDEIREVCSRVMDIYKKNDVSARPNEEATKMLGLVSANYNAWQKTPNARSTNITAEVLANYIFEPTTSSIRNSVSFSNYIPTFHTLVDNWGINDKLALFNAFSDQRMIGIFATHGETSEFASALEYTLSRCYHQTIGTYKSQIHNAVFILLESIHVCWPSLTVADVHSIIPNVVDFAINHTNAAIRKNV